jgi:hypothetical protein
MLKESSQARGANHGADAFEAAYGESIEELQDEFFAAAPELIPGEFSCDFPLLGTVDDVLEDQIRFDCAEPDTLGQDVLIRAVTLEVPVAGMYVVEVEAPARWLVSYCHDRQVEVGDSYEPDIRRPVRQFEPLWWEAAAYASIWLEAGAHELFLDSGRHRLDLEIPGPEPSTIRVRVHPRLGPPPGKGREWCARFPDAPGALAIWDVPGPADEKPIWEDSILQEGQPSGCRCAPDELSDFLETLLDNDEAVVLAQHESSFGGVVAFRDEVWAATEDHCSELADAQHPTREDDNCKDGGEHGVPGVLDKLEPNVTPLFTNSVVCEVQ